MKISLPGLLAVALSFLLPVGNASAAETDTRFDIVRYEVVGNSLLPQERVNALVAPYVGRQRVYGDVQKALEALDNAYRAMGYGTVNVYVPEQELTTGVVTIKVTEAVIGKVTVTGNANFDTQNVRNSLPLLQEGRAPNMRALSENVQLANENPAKKVELTLGVSEEEDKVDAKVEVKDEDPLQVSVAVDNTGSKASGVHRMNVSLQHSNVGNADQVLTMGYGTAIDPPKGVKVDIFSVGYRFPIYAIGDSIDLVYANSSTNTPANVIAPGGTLGINGKGEVIALRYNLIFPRQGEYSSRLVMGLDYKFINATCTNNGAPVPLGTVSSCTPYTLRPLSATYSGQWQGAGEIIGFNVGGIYHAFPMGSSWAAGTGTDRYSFVTGRPTNDRFAAVRLGASYTGVVMKDWMFRAAANGQLARNALPAGEQLGMAGSTAVRGFNERAVASDRGYVANLELYTPNYADDIGLPGDLKGVLFYDWADGSNVTAAANTARAHISSFGLGFRYSLNKDVTAKFDLAHVHDDYRPGPAGVDAAKPKLRGHFSVVFGF